MQVGIVERLGLRATVADFCSVFLLYFQEGPIETYDDLLRNDADLFVRYRLALIERGIPEFPSNLKRSHISYSHIAADIDETLQLAEDVLTSLTNNSVSPRQDTDHVVVLF